MVASPTSVLHGGTVQLSGRLQHANATESIAGETLTLERQPKGTTSWTSLATVTTASGGTLDPTQAVTPQAHTDYRLLHPATPFYAASTSQAVRVRVGVRLTARRNRPSMALGRTATISGQVTPPHRGQPIRPNKSATDLAHRPEEDPPSQRALQLRAAPPDHRDELVARL